MWMMLNLYPKPNYHNIPNIMVFLVPETQMNIESIDPKSGKEVCIGSELVVRLPHRSRGNETRHVNEEEPCVDKSTKRKKIAIKETSLKWCHRGVTCDVIVCRIKRMHVIGYTDV